MRSPVTSERWDLVLTAAVSEGTYEANICCFLCWVTVSISEMLLKRSDPLIFHNVCLKDLRLGGWRQGKGWWIFHKTHLSFRENEPILLLSPLCSLPSSHPHVFVWTLRIRLQARLWFWLQAGFLRFHSGLRVSPRRHRDVSVCQPLSVIQTLSAPALLALHHDSVTPCFPLLRDLRRSDSASSPSPPTPPRCW